MYLPMYVRMIRKHQSNLQEVKIEVACRIGVAVDSIGPGIRQHARGAHPNTAVNMINVSIASHHALATKTGWHFLSRRDLQSHVLLIGYRALSPPVI